MKLPESYRDIARSARKAGWVITRRRRSCHLRWESPSGTVVMTASTPGSSRSVSNDLAKLRRAGLRA